MVAMCPKVAEALYTDQSVDRESVRRAVAEHTLQGVATCGSCFVRTTGSKASAPTEPRVRPPLPMRSRTASTYTTRPRLNAPVRSVTAAVVRDREVAGAGQGDRVEVRLPRS